MRLLRCPDCKGKLAIDHIFGSRDEIERGDLRCKNCGSIYPIIRYIPRFVPSDYYVKSFSVQWNLFPRLLLGNETSADSLSTFVGRTGCTLSDLSGKTVLDAGCGMGRLTEIVSRKATTVVGVDLSLAVESAYKNLGDRANVHIIQADISKLPFARSSFDFIFSIGVLHHTPNTRESFRSLVPLLAENGEIAIWVYMKYDWARMSDLYRHLTSRMPWSMLWGLVKVIEKLHYLYEKMPKRLYRHALKITPISVDENKQKRLLSTFDWYSPRYQHRHSVVEVVSWFKESNLGEIEVLGYPVSVRGRKMPGHGQ